MTMLPPASSSPPRFARAAGLLLAGGMALAGILPRCPARAEDGARPAAGGAVLNLRNGGAVPGKLAEASQPGTIGWLAESFEAPFDFPLGEVESVRFPAPAGPPVAAGRFGFELSHGDLLYGSLVALDDRVAEVDATQLGRIRIDRGRVRRIFRWDDGADLVYNGPAGLAGWRDFAATTTPTRPPTAMAGGDPAAPPDDRGADPTARPEPKPARPSPGWVADGGQLVATQDGATIQADVGLPGRASVELELSWKQTPNFLVAFGVSADEKSFARAFRFEIWEGQIVVLRETDKDADLAPVQPVAAGPGRAHLTLLLDGELGKVRVYSDQGAALAELKIGGPTGPGATGIRLTNVKGDLRLERLRVGRWDGATTRPEVARDSLAQLKDRTIVRGPVERFDPATREFVIQGATAAVRVPEDRVEDLVLPRGDEDAAEAVRVGYADGTQVGGKWVGLADGRLTLTVPGVAGLVQLPQAGVRSLDLAGVDPKSREAVGLIGTLDVEGFRTKGWLVDRMGRAGEGALAWQPLASATASPIRPGVAGRIVYQVPASSTARPQQGRARVVRPVQPGQAADARSSFTFANANRRSLYLRGGDIIPGEITRIDPDGVWFRSPISENRFVPHAKVKAIELAADDPVAIRPTKAKFDRLLTVPRMQKESPPTHLIRSKNGDMLRARVIAMDEKSLRVEVRLEEKELARDRIAKIIWLHPDAAASADKPAAPAAAPPVARANRVQAVRSDGTRLTFVAEGVADGALLGTSDVLGPCKVALKDLDQLVLGAAIEEEATQLAYQNYKLQNAIEPRSAQDGGDAGPDGAAAGTESPLVGKPAPDFELDLLGGARFRLADQKGQVVVLDFWASWCGPCIQAMPQIDRATGEFADRGVRLVAVNLQETPAQIQGMLDRLKLAPRVALDRNGVVAAKYAATAIPQTVVIDREGKIARLFVGGGPHLGDQLRDALQALMPAKE